MDALVPQPLAYRDGDYFEAANGSLVSKEAVVLGEENIYHVDGRLLVCARAVLRGDAARISLGANVVIRSDVVLRPSPPPTAGTTKAASVPLVIGNFVVIDEGAVVFAKSVGNFVRVGKKAILGHGCVLEDCVDVAPGAEVPPGAVIPAFTRVASPTPGAVAVRVCELLPCWKQCRSFEIDDIFDSLHKLPAQHRSQTQQQQQEKKTTGAQSTPHQQK